MTFYARKISRFTARGEQIAREFPIKNVWQVLNKNFNTLKPSRYKWCRSNLSNSAFRLF